MYSKFKINHPYSGTLFTDAIRDVDENGDVQFPEFHDVKFQVGDDKIGAHKIILSTISPTFANMFHAEKDKNEFTIETTYGAFIEFRQFFYTNDLQLSFENIGEVITLTSQYGNANMRDTCGRFLAMNLNDTNVLKRYEIARKHNLEELSKICLNYIAVAAARLVNSFEDCEPETFEAILSLDSIQCLESQLLLAVFAFGCKRAVTKKGSKENVSVAEIRSEVGDLVFLIRFRSMNHGQFAHEMDEIESFFTPVEYIQIIKLLGGIETLNTKFSVKYRNSVTTNEK